MSFLRMAAIAGGIAIAGGLPMLLGVMIDRHVLERAQTTLVSYAERMLTAAELRLDDTVSKFNRLDAEALLGCDGLVRRDLADITFDIPTIDAIAVIDETGAVVCSAAESQRQKIVTARIPTAMEGLDLAILRDSASGYLLLGIVYADLVYVRFQRDSFLLDVLPIDWRATANMALLASDGTMIERVPRQARVNEGNRPDSLVVELTSQRYPLTVLLSVPVATVLGAAAGVKHAAMAGLLVVILALFGLVLAIGRGGPRGDAEINRALARRELFANYQPVISMATGLLEGCEVLMRRRLPDGGMETPVRMIDRAEANGQIVPMTVHLMRKAVVELEELYADRPKLTMAFNLCPLHFMSDQIVRDVEKVFGNSRIRFSQLIFEVTERQPFDDLVTAKSVTAKLQALGCRVALDDAGTGHGGLAIIQRLGLDILKIDRIFVDAIDANTRQAPIIDKLLEMARGLSMDVVAEGVETIDQMRYLKQRGATLAQGYLFAPPLPPKSFVELAYAMVPVTSQPATSDMSETAAPVPDDNTPVDGTSDDSALADDPATEEAVAERAA